MQEPQQQDERDDVTFLILGFELSVKLSYKKGTLKGTETFYRQPSRQYWLENYDLDSPGGLPFLIRADIDVAFVTRNGFFLFWNSDEEDFHATEMVGENPVHIPDMLLNLSDLFEIYRLDQEIGIQKDV